MELRRLLLGCLYALVGLASMPCHAGLIVISNADFAAGSWAAVDIDGDGVADVEPAAGSQWTAVVDSIVPGSMMGNVSPDAQGGVFLADDNGVSHFDIDDATFGFEVDPTAGVGADNAALLPRSVPAGGVGHLAHGTQSSELGGSAISLIAFWIEPPTTGAATGRFSGANHNDDYYLITHDFGDIPDGTGINFDLPTVLTNAAAVPEPSGFLLALSLTAAVLFPRGRRSRRVKGQGL